MEIKFLNTISIIDDFISDKELIDWLKKNINKVKIIEFKHKK